MYVILNGPLPISREINDKNIWTVIQNTEVYSLKNCQDPIYHLNEYRYLYFRYIVMPQFHCIEHQLHRVPCTSLRQEYSLAFQQQAAAIVLTVFLSTIHENYKGKELNSLGHTISLFHSCLWYNSQCKHFHIKATLK